MSSKTTTASLVDSTGKLNSDASGLSEKYGGLIHRSAYKVFRMRLIQLFNYVYTVAPQFQTVHIIITVIRLLQIAGPSLLESSHSWNVNALSNTSAQVISILFHLIPPVVRDEGGAYLCYVYAVLSLLMFILIGISANVFNKNAKLPAIIPSIITFYMASINFILPPIAINFAAEFVSDTIFTKPDNIDFVRLIILPVVVVLSIIIFSWLFILIATQTLIFRPISLMTTLVSPQNWLYIFTIVINMLTGFASHASDIVLTVMMVLTIIVYAFVALLPFYLGGFVSKNNDALVSSAAVSAIIVCVSQIVMSFMDNFMGLPLIFVLVLCFMVLTLVIKIILNAISAKHYKQLDEFLDSKEISLFKSPSHMINCVIDGLIIAHPSVVSGELLKESINVWPQNTKVWYLFAKISSIYPEDTTTLSWIYHSIIASKLKGTTARTIKEQALTISRQRETNLSPKLKLKLNSILKENQSAKHKLRHIWDLAIQGSIGEMESSIKRFYKELEASDAEFKHLFRQYPNNRFVTRSYARFCKELKASHTEYSEFLEKSRQLQRGQIVNEDFVHKLGLLAFPNLPKRINHKCDSLTATSTEQSSCELTDNDETDNLQEETMSNSLRDTIEAVSIPSIICTKSATLILIFFLFIAPIIGLFIYSAIFISTIADPLTYMYDLSLLNSRTMMLVAFNTRYFYQTLKVYNFTVIQDNVPVLFGNTWDIGGMLNHILGKVTGASQEVYNLRSFNSNNENIKKAQDLIFGDSIEYVYYIDLHMNKTILQTLQTGIMDMVAQSSNLLKQPKLEFEFCNTSMILNPIHNLLTVDTSFETAMKYLIEYIRDNDNLIRKISGFAMIAAICLIIITFLVTLIVEVVWIQKNKEETYKCLTSLPKPTVSGLVENLRVLKTEDGNDSTTNTDTEMSKQEDNIMKILVTGGDNTSSKLTDRIPLIIGSLSTIVLDVVAMFLFVSLIQYQSRRLVINAPHLNYLNSVYSQALACQFILHFLTLSYNKLNCSIQIFDDATWEERFITRINEFRRFYTLTRFGGPDANDIPYSGFDAALEVANTYITCENRYVVNPNFMKFAGCLDTESLFIFFDATLSTYYDKQNLKSLLLQPDGKIINFVWSLLITPLYDGFFGPMFEEIIPTIRNELQVKQTSSYIPLIIILIVGVLIQALVYVQILSIEKHIRSVLRLLLHCPQTVVLSTQKVASILSGDFSQMKGDITKRNSEFYDKVFQLLPDAILICDQVTNEILSASHACTRILFKNEEDLIGKNAKELLQSDAFSGNTGMIFKNSTSVSNKSVEICGRDPEGGTIYLEVTTMKANNQLAINISDVTSVVRYNTLIQDERAKSDTLLASILPASLVQRVQSGEKNISFAVQSATILFLDIVSFTPWCGSNEANKVMSTLNLMFKKLDYALSKYTTMTKVKCIGDCYMAAGGIFSEVNQPAEHAKEVVNFGLDSLDVIRELDQELDERLQIRVGINTGGPIVAGVLGIGKPTFEILGPAINMAQQMEHHGIPMKVHISRPVYELIYGDSFKIKERGSVDVKHGTVITYLVEDRSN